MPVTGDSDSGDSGRPPEPAWHERTPTLVAASVGALAVIAIVYFLVSTIAKEFGDPDPVQQYFLEPSGTSSRTSLTATTTTQTVTSTRAPITTDINPGDETTTSGTETTTSGTSGTETSETSTTTSRSPSSTTEDDDETTRSRPRLNETRTLYPRP